MKLFGGCVGYLMGTDSGVSCCAGATIFFTDTTLLCIRGLGDVIGILVVATLENLAKGGEGEVGTSIRLVGKTASVACWIALDSLSFSVLLSWPVGKNIGTVSPLFGVPGTALGIWTPPSSSVLLGGGVIPGNTQPSYS